MKETRIRKKKRRKKGNRTQEINRVMHIRRMIEESTGVRSEGKNITVVSSTTASSIISRDPLLSEIEESRRKNDDDDEPDDERSIDERLITYATIDCLALKRARLPLQLLPIEDDDAARSDAASEDRSVRHTAINGKITTAAAAGTISRALAVPRRPTCRVRSGPAMTDQWKRRTRSRFQPSAVTIENKREEKYRSIEETSIATESRLQEERPVGLPEIADRSKKLTESSTDTRVVDSEKPETKFSGRESEKTGNREEKFVKENFTSRGPFNALVKSEKVYSNDEKIIDGPSRLFEEPPEIRNNDKIDHRSEITASDVKEDDAPVYEAVSEFSTDSSHYSFPRRSANASFLWRNVDSRRSAYIETTEAAGKAVNGEIFNDNEKIDRSKDRDWNCDDDTYDDVGLSPCFDAEDDNYDDVGPSQSSLTSIAAKLDHIRVNTSLNEDDCELYDDVAPASTLNPSSMMINRSESTGNHEEFHGRPSNDEKKNNNDDLSDDGWSRSIDNDYSSVDDETIPEDRTYDDVRLVPSRQERVNSLYAGSGSRVGFFDNGGESEWEDLDDNSDVARRKIIRKRSKNVRRHKSRITGLRSQQASRSASRASVKADTDTASDDSNYETLFSSLPSDGSSEAIDDDDSSWPRNGVPTVSRIDRPETREEAPSRPVPPPPRESSLTETLGRRMKMLRRTWSITKGSLGRMRGRATSASNPEDGGGNAGCGNRERSHHVNDARCYFGLKMRFGKSVTGLSTFYLGTNDDDVNETRDESNIYDDAGYRRCTENGNQRSILDEEPLYQFYAAAAARVSFESDSEGYEEVEDPTPSASTADLARPGHRTLWCQTPRVRNSGLLQTLTPEERKCQEAKFEILTSEASYLNSLRVLVDEFLSDHDLVYEVLATNEREKLFAGVPGVLTASECLLNQLEAAWREDPMLRGLPEILSNHAEKSSSVYVAYCSNQVSIDATLKELRSRRGSKFVETVARIEARSACQSLSLHSFLMLPMQRVTRLPLLADAVSSRLSSESADEREHWEKALSRLSRVVEECNEGARAAGRLAEMEALERKLTYSSKVPPILLRDRYLVRRGPVVRVIAKSDVDHALTFGKKYRKARLYLMLLTDYLLIARCESSGNEETYAVIDTCKRSLVELERVPDDSPLAGRFAMILTLLENHSGRHVEYVLTCKDPTERERWLDAVSPAKPGPSGEESLYETWDCPQVVALYPYAAAQPDELSLQPGDVINVTRKMTDGWYLGEKLIGGEQGWFPGNYAREVASEHVRARNLRQRHRLLALSASVLQQRAKRASR